MAHVHHGHEPSRGHGTEGVGSRRESCQRRLRIVLALTLVYMVAEIVGGRVAGSLALMADAAHMASDAAALGGRER